MMQDHPLRVAWVINGRLLFLVGMSRADGRYWRCFDQIGGEDEDEDLDEEDDDNGNGD